MENIMAMAPTKIRLTPEEYIQNESSSNVKHEYCNGNIAAMADESRSHNLISLTLASEIKQHLKNTNFRTYIFDMKVHIEGKEKDLYYYPDVMVSSDDSSPSEYYEEKPILIVEVLSPSSKARD